MAKEYTWTQVEPALAILCSCLVTLRPLFVNLNLNISNYSSRFSRSKNPSSSKATSSTETSKEHHSHVQWPGTRDSRHKDSMRLSSKGMSAKGGLHIVNIDLGTTDRKAAYTQISNSWSTDKEGTRNQHPSSKAKHIHSRLSMTEGEEIVVDHS